MIRADLRLFFMPDLINDFRVTVETVLHLILLHFSHSCNPKSSYRYFWSWGAFVWWHYWQKMSL